MMTVIGKLDALMDKYKTGQTVGDEVVAFALLCPFDLINHAAPIRPAFAFVVLLLVARMMSTSYGEASSVAGSIFRGVTGMSVAAILFAVVVPFAEGHGGVGWTALLSVFGGYLLLTELFSFFLIVSPAISRRRGSRTAKREEMLADLRAALSEKASSTPE